MYDTLTTKVFVSYKTQLVKCIVDGVHFSTAAENGGDWGSVSGRFMYYSLMYL